ncbi:serine hydrolase domain-containing protein [Streptomyces sp. NPDC018019]|uniref:serine hydrolase domain-containing protein n=1 Tax=Streptomyces sp. NPDC018019 TaxID=3365030 RepID=UPI00379655A6
MPFGTHRLSGTAKPATHTPTRRASGTRATALAMAVTAVLATGPAAGAATPDRRPDGHRATQDALRAVVERGGLPGVAAEVDDAHGRWFGSAGHADTATGRERTRADHFRAASITKVFIATVLLQLEEEGELDLDDTVEKWLPGLVRGNGNDGRAIRLRQLLNHTSGLFNYTADPEFARRTSGPGFLQHRYDTYRPEELVALAMKRPPHSTPDRTSATSPATATSSTSSTSSAPARPSDPPTPPASYSNTNFVVAGMVIEKVTGHSYAHEVQRRILTPLKLRETSFPGLRPQMPLPHPTAYSRLRQRQPGAPVVDATEQNMSWLGAAGDVISTTGDLNTFFRALLRGKLLGPAATRQMFTTVPAEVRGFRYGLGIESVTLSCGVTVVGKTGRANGSVSGVVGTRDGGHQLTFNINGDWLGDASSYAGVVEAEFCGPRSR